MATPGHGRVWRHLSGDYDLSTEYELEILGPDDDVRCTVTGLVNPTFTYTAAMQTEDFPEGIRPRSSPSTRSALR